MSSAVSRRVEVSVVVTTVMPSGLNAACNAAHTHEDQSSESLRCLLSTFKSGCVVLAATHEDILWQICRSIKFLSFRGAHDRRHVILRS